MNLLQDFKERFLNFETVKGVYLLPAGGVICYVTLFYLQYKPRHDFLDACAALTRPCLVNINSMSNHAVLRHDAPSTYGKPSIHIQGLTVIQHGRLKSAPM
jgi:hypothetical protein